MTWLQSLAEVPPTAPPMVSPLSPSPKSPAIVIAETSNRSATTKAVEVNVTVELNVNSTPGNAWKDFDVSKIAPPKPKL